jgi:hypothetical protein
VSSARELVGARGADQAATDHDDVGHEDACSHTE